MRIDNLVFNKVNFYYLYPMKRIRVVNTNETFQALNNEDLVNQLRQTSFSPGKNNHDFMKQYARRSVLMADEDIRATDEDAFVEDLLKYGHLVIEDATERAN
ncbi:hypothetical protein EDL98_01355 [Ornithobacterium rhinotracheale]|nr:hypothetical protein [Ornithobacterium rhinotracheale]